MIKNIIFICLITFSVQGCEAQTAKNEIICNRKTADKSLARQLPKGICIPDNYTVDQVIANLDFNQDEKKDIVVRYSEYPLSTGTNRYYAIFQGVNDTMFVLKKELQNIIPPYLKNIYSAASGSDTMAYNLVHSFPYDLKIEFVNDTIKLSHLIPEYYGKTYEFVFSKPSEDWLLQRIKYWIGGLDQRDIERMDLNIKLTDRNTIETKKPDDKTPIEKFSLSKSRKVADTEEKEYFMNTYNLFEWSEKQKP